MNNALMNIRMSPQDAHYGGDLVDGSRILKSFGDLATELLIKNDGDEGLFLTYENVQFLHPVYSGDYVEAKAKIVSAGKTSRKIEFEAHIVIKSRKDISDSAADYLKEPILICKATGVCVVKDIDQRKNRM